MSQNTCGARTRSGGRCKHPAGWGTSHVGQGRCKLHGGASLRGPEHPNFTHGRHSKYFHASNLVGFDEWKSTLGLQLDLEDDILAMMFVVREMVLKGEPVTVMTTKGPVPLAPDADYIARCMERIARAAEKLWQHREGVTVNVRLDDDSQRLMEALGDALVECVSEPDERQAVMHFLRERLGAGT